MALRSVAQISAKSTSSNIRIDKLEDIFEFTLKSTAAHMFRYCLIAFFMGSILATRLFKFTHQFSFFWGGGARAQVGARPPYC